MSAFMRQWRERGGVAPLMAALVAGLLSPALMVEAGREMTIDPETEAKLLEFAKQPLKDVLIMIQDTGMRPEEVCRI